MDFKRKVRNIASDYWSVASLGIGAVLLSTISILPDEVPRVIFYAFLFLGIPATISGYIFQFVQNRTNSTLKDENRNLKDRLSRQIFIVASAVTDNFQNELMQQLLNRLRARRLRPQLFVPSRNHARSEQNEIFDEILKSKDDFAAGIIIPAYPEDDRESIHDFITEMNMPIVFADNPPFINKEQYGENTIFVGVDSSLGGKLAAEAAVEYGKREPLERILVISSNSQTQR